MSEKQVCVITNGDSHIGYALAYCLMEQNRQRGENAKLRVLCRHKEGLEKLAEMGAEIREIDYKHEDQVRECFKNVKAGMLIPEHSREMLQEGENVIKACKNENVEHLCMFSLVGVDRLQEDRQFEIMNQYCELEKKHREMMGREKGSIIRNSMVDQIFYFMAPMLEGQGVLRLPVKKDKKWGTVDMHDILEAVMKMANESRRGNALFGVIGNGRKEIYQFAPQQVHQMEELARHIGQGLERDELRYEEISREDMRKWLEKMREDKRFRERPGREKEPVAVHGRDKPHYFPLGHYLNDCMINMLLEIWELANQGRMDVSSNDLKEILGRHPTGIREYFKNNRQQFRDLR